jgi:NAD(P)-dependent dehydrogenase (short-subunit alcohol dehydrogenase family)
VPLRCRAASSLGGLDILVNNVAFQHPVDDLTEISDEQWRRTFAVNIDSYFYVTKAAVPQLPDGGTIVNTSSINGLRGNKKLLRGRGAGSSDIGHAAAVLPQVLGPAGVPARLAMFSPGRRREINARGG